MATMTTRKKTRIFDTIRSYMPRLTRRSRRVAPSSTEVSVLASQEKRIEELQEILDTIERQITDYTAKYENAMKRAHQSSNIRVGRTSGLQHLKFSKIYNTHLVTLERQKLIIEAEILSIKAEILSFEALKIQKTLVSATSIKELQALLDTIEENITKYKSNYDNKKADALNANSSGDRKTAIKHMKLYKIYETHLKSLEVQKLRTEELINQKAPGSLTARDASTSRKGGKIMRKSKRKTRRHKI